MRNPFQIKGRSAWQAEYRFADGTVQRASYADKGDAADWLTKKQEEDQAEEGPLLGGSNARTQTGLGDGDDDEGSQE